MSVFNDLCKVHDVTLCVWVLEENSRDIFLAEVDVENVADLYVDSEGQGASLDTADGLRVQLVAQYEPFSLVHPEKIRYEMFSMNSFFIQLYL